MRARDLARGVGVLAVTAAVVVAAAYVGGVVTSQPTAVGDAPDAPAYDASELAVEPVSDEGSVTAPGGGESKTIVVDVSHGNGIGENEMQPVVDALVAAGHEVRFYGGSGSGGFQSDPAAAFNETLRGADALVAASPGSAYSDAEVAGVAAFADAGGRVLLAADPPTTTSSSTSVSVPGLSTGSTASAAGQPANLAAEFGIAFGSGYLYDVAENANGFQRVYATGAGDLGAGVDRAVVDAATPLTTSENATAVLTASDVTLSSTRKTGEYALAARNGNVLAVGDTDFMTADGATAGDTDAFASNVVAFLVSGDKEPGAPEPSTPGGGAGGGAGGGTGTGSFGVRAV
jgi:hypothetical protein